MHKNDINAAAKIFYKFYRSNKQEWLLENCLKRIEDNFNPNSCWIAEIESKIIGILISKLDYCSNDRELYIDILAIDPEYNNMNVDSKLLSTAKNYAKSNNYKYIWLFSKPNNILFNWYKESGFKETDLRGLVIKI